ncbi:MAG: GrdX family protein [Clostridium sp.]
MFDIGKCILVTNNDRAAEKFKNSIQEIYLLDSYDEVLKKSRDLIHTHHKLLTHPQASSLKPNQTPYRTILLYSEGNKDNTDDVLLIEEAIAAYEKWTAIKKVPKYDEKIAFDYKTIDLSMIENVIPKL